MVHQPITSKHDSKIINMVGMMQSPTSMIGKFMINNSRVNNSSSCDNRTIEGDQKANSGSKLHQLLYRKSRTDIVAAG